jgi:hypothetical protein
VISAPERLVSTRLLAAARNLPQVKAPPFTAISLCNELYEPDGRGIRDGRHGSL